MLRTGSLLFYLKARCSASCCVLDPSPDPLPDTERGALVPPSSQEGGLGGRSHTVRNI